MLVLLGACTNTPVQTPALSRTQPTPGGTGTGPSSGTSGISTPASVTGVTISPALLTLNAPNVGGTSAGFATTGQFSAVVTMSDGSTTSLVTWSSASSSLLTVSASGLATVQAGATPQTVAISAISQANPNEVMTANVVIQNQGTVGVTIQ